MVRVERSFEVLQGLRALRYTRQFRGEIRRHALCFARGIMAPPRVNGSPDPRLLQLPPPPPDPGAQTSPSDGPGSKRTGYSSADAYERATPTVHRHLRRPNLSELAKSPSDAHVAWKRLGTVERMEVLGKMGKLYGDDFARDFLAATKDPKKRSDLTRTYGPGVGPSEEKLKAAGFKPYARAYYNEIWVHPSDETVMKVLDRGKTPPAVQKDVDPIVNAGVDTVADMKRWLDDLRQMKKDTPEMRESYRDFWTSLTEARDEIKDTLANGKNLDSDTRKALEQQLKQIESINTKRHETLGDTTIDVPAGSSSVLMVEGSGQWLYVSPTN